MTNRSLEERLDAEPVRVDCPLCRHGQWIDATPGRCDQCGSEIEVFEAREAAREAVEALHDAGRVAYRMEVGHDLWAVVANRAFRSPSG